MKTRSSSSSFASRLRRRCPRGRTRLFVLGGAVLASGAPLMPAVSAAAPRDVQQSPVAPSEATVTVDIAPGPLADVLAAFQHATALAVTLINADVATLPSPGVRGTMTARQAMAALLTGTAVQAVFDEGGVHLALASVSESVLVSGRALAAVSSPRYTVPLRDIAQTVALVPRAVLEQQGAATLTDALRNVPGITLQAGEGGGSSSTAGDLFNLRGFSASNSLFVDNVRDSGLMARDVFNVEQVEVFMGPTGSDVGRGTAAGYVNMQSKRPHARTEYSVSAAGGSADQARVTADFNWGVPAGPESSWLSHSAIRVNALWQDRGVPGRDLVKNESQAVAPSVMLGIGTPTRVVASAQLVRQDNLPDYGVPTAAWAEDLLAPTVVQTVQPVRQANYYGSPRHDYDEAEQTSYLARVEHDVNRRLMVANQTRANRTHREAVVSAVTGVGSYVPSTGLVTVARQGNERENTIVSNQTTVVDRFTTGRLRHGVSGGLDVARENQFAPALVGVGTRAPVNILAPNPNDPISDYAPARSLAETEGTTTSVAIYANDAVEVGQRWLFGGGFRLERYETHYRAVDATGLTTADLTAHGALVSGRASALFRLNNSSNLYLSYGTTVTPPGEANFQLSTVANNVNSPNLEPQRSANVELGSKVELFGGQLALSGAVFRTRNRNVIYTIDAVAVPPIFNQDDEQLVKGVTVGALGQVKGRWQVIANVAYLDARLESQGANHGRQLTLTPAFSGSLWTTVAVWRGISLGGGVRHVGGSYVNAANTIRIPPYSIVDGLVEHVLNPRLTLRLNAYNLTNEVYVKNVNNNGGRYNPGNPRSVLLSTVVRF